MTNQNSKLSEGETKTQGQKPKTSRLAIASIACIIGFIVFVFLFTMSESARADAFSMFFALAMCACLLAAPILGIVALRKIKRSNGLLAGKGLAIAGISISAFCIALGFIMPQVGKMPPKAYMVQCMGHMYAIGDAINFYAEENDGKYPAADKWCDLLVDKYAYKEHFLCRAACLKGDKGPCHYGINPNCKPNSPNDVVLLFETQGGWNQVGGPEILTTENHKGKGCNVLFNDRRVEFVKPERLGELKWEAEEGEK